MTRRRKVKWECRKKCGECCGVIIIPTHIYRRNLERRQVPVVEFETERGVLPQTDDLFCCFLNRETKLCVIYETRPRVCTIYGLVDNLQCPYITTSGLPRTDEEIRRILALQERCFDGFVNALRIRDEVKRYTIVPNDKSE